MGRSSLLARPDFLRSWLRAVPDGLQNAALMATGFHVDEVVASSFDRMEMP